MGSDARTHRGPLRRVGRRIIDIFEGLEIIAALVAVLRLLALPFRLLAKLADLF